MPLATHVEPVQFNDTTPSEADMESVIFCLRSFMAGRHTQIRAENFKQWMWEAYPEDYYKNPPADQSMDVSGEHRPTHLALGGYPAGVVVDRLGTHT